MSRAPRSLLGASLPPAPPPRMFLEKARRRPSGSPHEGVSGEVNEGTPSPPPAPSGGRKASVFVTLTVAVRRLVPGARRGGCRCLHPPPPHWTSLLGGPQSLRASSRPPRTCARCRTSRALAGPRAGEEAVPGHGSPGMRPLQPSQKGRRRGPESRPRETPPAGAPPGGHLRTTTRPLSGSWF